MLGLHVQLGAQVLSQTLDVLEDFGTTRERLTDTATQLEQLFMQGVLEDHKAATVVPQVYLDLAVRRDAWGLGSFLNHLACSQLGGRLRIHFRQLLVKFFGCDSTFRNRGRNYLAHHLSLVFCRLYGFGYWHRCCCIRRLDDFWICSRLIINGCVRSGRSGCG